MSGMPTLRPPKAKNVRCTNDALEVTLSNGLVIATPLSRFPRLRKGSPEQRRHWEFIGGGAGIHWEELDEDISVKGLLKSVVGYFPKGSFPGISFGRSKQASKRKITVPA